MVSCGTLSNKSANDILPRKGYIYIKKTVDLRICVNDICTQGQMASAGSGFVVKKTYKGSFIVTAAHVCSTEKEDIPENIKFRDNLYVETLGGDTFKAVVVSKNTKIDVCMIFAEDLVDGVKEVKLASRAPKEGDKVVPIFEGRYIGSKGFTGLFTFDAGPGSSGSMILNDKGELIGVLHSVFTKMHSVVVAVEFYALKQFIRRSLIEHATSHVQRSKKYYEIMRPPYI
jgi:S1-C subfamily serine protease